VEPAPELASEPSAAASSKRAGEGLLLRRFKSSCLTVFIA
jgi:hypothetical protein